MIYFIGVDVFKRKHSAASKEKIRKAMTGKKKSKETMIKISETLSKRLMKNKSSYRAFAGHVSSIYNSIDKYRIIWKLPISDLGDFRDWSYSDPAYEELFNTWKKNGFNKFDIPVVMRKVKKLGFIIENLEWRRKGEYSWWGEDYEILKSVEEDLDKQQKERNQRSKEWRKKIREEWKAKRKDK
jgi:hypothetical protein